MDATKVMHEVTKASDEERITFPEVVKALMEAGVERYHADLVAATRTFYMPDGRSETVGAHKVEAALRAIQALKIQYREFCTLIARAGCVGYLVSLAGRRAVYYGRTGDLHVEWFPK